ncbi:MAG: hypothetical protein R3B46_04400 [Phycisphaerales bacterium]
MPLSSLQANIDHGFAEAFTTYAIGGRLWSAGREYSTEVDEETQSRAV